MDNASVANVRSYYCSTCFISIIPNDLNVCHKCRAIILENTIDLDEKEFNEIVTIRASKLIKESHKKMNDNIIAYSNRNNMESTYVDKRVIGYILYLECFF